MKRISIFLALLLTAGIVSAQVIDKNTSGSAGSLWVDGQNPLLDRTARREGDIITILISESSAASYAASTTTSKQDSNTLSTNLLNSLFGLLKVSPTTSSNSKGGGTGNTTQTGSLRARMSAVVKTVLPNGNLIVEGSRKIVVNKDAQLFKLMGIVRRDDIAADNSILSESIAQAEIYFKGKGQIADRQRKGILTTLLDWLF